MGIQYQKQDRKYDYIEHYLFDMVKINKTIVIRIIDDFEQIYGSSYSEVMIKDLNYVMRECLNQQVQITEVQLNTNRSIIHHYQLEDQILLNIKHKQPNLLHLTIYRLNISLKGLAIIKDSWKSLTKLQLSNNNINQKGAKILASCQFEALQEFCFLNNKVSMSADGLRALPKANWPKINLIVMTVKQSVLFSCPSLKIFSNKQNHGYDCNKHINKDSCCLSCKYFLTPLKENLKQMRPMRIDDIL